jgi:hypothetical protein
MKTIYVDSDFKCHMTDDGTMTKIETDFFDDKCDTFIEGYRFIPDGETWTRSDGTVFQGEMITPWKNYSELDAAQRKYEKQLLIDVLNILEITNTK